MALLEDFDVFKVHRNCFHYNGFLFWKFVVIHHVDIKMLVVFIGDKIFGLIFTELLYSYTIFVVDVRYVSIVNFMVKQLNFILLFVDSVIYSFFQCSGEDPSVNFITTSSLNSLLYLLLSLYVIIHIIPWSFVIWISRATLLTLWTSPARFVRTGFATTFVADCHEISIFFHRIKGFIILVLYFMNKCPKFTNINLIFNLITYRSHRL